MEPRSRLHLLAAAALVQAAPLAGAARLEARVLVSQKDALALAFGGAAAERRTAFLTNEQALAVEKAAQSKLDSRMWTFYVSGSTTAYFESHLVRTMNETIMIVVGADGRPRFVEILSFAEPPDYMASKPWLAQFAGKPLNEDLAPRRALRNIAGATLTSEAVAHSVRRALAVHQVLNTKPAK